LKSRLHESSTGATVALPDTIGVKRWQQAALVGTSLIAMFLAAGVVQMFAWAQAIRLVTAVALGPILGWITVCIRGQVMAALPLLFGLTTLSVLPLLAWLSTPRHSGLLWLGMFTWFGAGWYFAVGMWV
jgi:hypothetical protein